MLRSLLAIALAALLLWALYVNALYISGRRGEARALATFLPDCLVLARRLLADPALPRSSKVALLALLAYLALPLDLVPDFLPVVGQLDDAILVALTLRFIFRSAPPGRLAELWTGSPAGLAVISRLAASDRRSLRASLD
ncbi:MAG TPA: YkvA family protein [Solirubrobacterales bacterium]|nr:YkvA family protein [Solirubrobacterales bacterium]